MANIIISDSEPLTIAEQVEKYSEIALPIECMADDAIVKRLEVNKVGALFVPSIKGGTRVAAGVIMRVGPGRWSHVTGQFYPSGLKQGDVVGFKNFDNYQEITFDGGKTTYLHLKLVDILYLLTDISQVASIFDS